MIMFIKTLKYQYNDKPDVNGIDNVGTKPSYTIYIKNPMHELHRIFFNIS